MQIKRLELSGFKSFMNPVQLDFGGGITAILGPNGCGKSNVVDAIRWVLGEQSAKQLRGEKMQNVVFGGTHTRKPLGLAEVAVSFVNNQGRLPVAYDEVKLTRRLTRDGQSDYLLNGVSCRLKDIKDLITDTGAGSHAYSIIEREMVDSVINGHEESRRFLFEEASGIMKYRMRRKEATRKLELTEQDLLRLNDIIDEIARTVRSLRRQMGRATRYQELQQRVRTCETYLAQKRLFEYRAESAALEAQLADLGFGDVGDDAAGDALAAQIEVLRAALVDRERAHRAAFEVADAVAKRLKGSEDAILVLRERTDSTRESRAAAQAEIGVVEHRVAQVSVDRARLEAERSEFATRLDLERAAFQVRKEQLGACEERHEAARSELMQIKQRTFDFAQGSATRRSELELARARFETHAARGRELQEDLDVEAARIARLTEEHAAISAELEQADAAVVVHRGELQQAGQDIEINLDRLDRRREERADLASRLEATRSRHDLLRSMIDAFEGYGDGARALLQRHTASGRVLGTLAERVTAPEGLEAAFDALLHDVLDALLVHDAAGAMDLVGELRGDKLGRATLLLSDSDGDHAPRVAAGIAERPGVIGRAVDLLQGDAPSWLRRLLAHAVLVEDMPAALALVATTSDPALRIATRDGMLVTGAGTVSGGSDRERDVRLLGRRQRLEELAAEARTVESEIELVLASLVTLEAELGAAREHRAAAEARVRAEEARRQTIAVSRATVETTIAEASARRAQAGAALEQVAAEREAVAELLPQLSSDAERFGREEGDHGRALQEREDAFAALDRERERLRHEVGEARVAFVTLQGEAESHARQLERMGELERELQEQRRRRQDEIERGDRDLERYAAELATASEQAAAQAAELGVARDALAEIALDLDARRAAIDGEQARLHEIEKERRAAQGRRHAAEMALAECTMRRKNLLDRIEENYRLREDELAALVFEWTDADPVPDENVVRELRDEIARLGPVNLLALEEHEEKNARLEFLEAQRADLIEATQSLHETIERINQTAKFLFLETYEQVRAHFRDTIRTVFDGGEGDLVLLNPEDPLDTDIEIMVRPRGKKIDTLTQLSSGERALTAIALLFSIYLVKPSPFCVFDEVDAPLDDANIGRFVALLQEFKNRTQFIVITHNKLTMEAADRLYGVTMEEEGVSKLVSVALDGDLERTPRKLQKKTERAARVAAILAPSTAESAAAAVVGEMADFDADAPRQRGKRARGAAATLEGDEQSSNGGGATAVMDDFGDSARDAFETPPQVDPEAGAHGV